MRVAFIAQPTDALEPPVEGGSLAIWIYQVARRCALRGHEATAFTNRGSTIRSHSFTDEGVRYVRQATGLNTLLNGLGRLASRPSATRLPDFAAGWRDAGYGLAAARRARQMDCQIVHITNYSQLAPLVRRVHPQARICLHMACEWLTQLDPAAVHRRLSSVDCVIGCSDFITRSIADRFPQFAARCVTIPNAVAWLPEHQLGAHDSGHVLFVGRVSPEKGLHVLVPAFRQVLQHVPEAKLRIVGGFGAAPMQYLVALSDDPLVARLEAFYRPDAGSGKDPYLEHLEAAAGPELGRSIFFEGRVDHSRVDEYYRSASILVNPSLSEAFGMSLVEGMMHRLPVVASAVGGMSNIVMDGQTGLLVPAGDVDALAGAICRLLADRPLQHRMGDEGRRRAATNFTWDVTTDALLSLFERLVSSGPIH